jgi:nucleoside-diphosphate-sugar epimerase
MGERQNRGDALVTGGGGFLGGAIVRQLLREEYSVRSFSRGSYPELTKLGVEQFRGDLADSQAVKKASAGCSIVFHVAAKWGMTGEYSEYYRTNVEGTANIIEACRHHSIQKLVFTSSPSVVFDGKDMDGADESVPYPSSYKAAYPETKAIAEKLVVSSNGEDLATVSLRPHLIWGPRDTQLIPGILDRGRKGRLVKIRGKPKLVDFTYIDDAAAAHLLAAQRLQVDSAIAGRVYFVTQDSPMPLWDFIDRVLSVARLPRIKRSVSPRVALALGWAFENAYQLLPLKGDPPLTRFIAEELSTSHWFDISATKRDLGYRPQFTMDEGFHELSQWLGGDCK